MHTDIAVFTLVSHMEAEFVAETSRALNGVAVWLATCQWCVSVRNGDILIFRDYETAALWFRAGLKLGEQEHAVAR